MNNNKIDPNIQNCDRLLFSLKSAQTVGFDPVRMQMDIVLSILSNKLSRRALKMFSFGHTYGASPEEIKKYLEKGSR